MTEIIISLDTLPMTLRNLREYKRLTQEQAADIIGVRRESVCNWETGYRTPSWDSLQRLVKAYGCKVEFVISEAQI